MATGASETDSEQYTRYFDTAFLTEKLGQSIGSVEVKERPLFASGVSRLWHLVCKTDDGQSIDLYGKFLRQDSAHRQAQLLQGLASCGVNCPVVLYTSNDDRFYLYRSVVGSTLVDSLTQFATDELVDKLVALVNAVHNCRAAAEQLAPVDISAYRAKLQQSIEVGQKMLPKYATSIGRIGQKVLASLGQFSGDDFSHGDLNPWNIIVDNNELGIIDFSEAGRAVPELDWGTFLSSLDFLLTNMKVDAKAVTNLRDALRTKLIANGFDQELLKAASNFASLTHLWVISFYGKEIEKNRPIAQQFWELIILDQ